MGLVMKRIRSSEKFIEFAKKRHGDKFLYRNTVYTGKNNDVVVTCAVHGDITVKVWLFSRSNYSCRLCDLKSSSDKFIEQSKNTHGDKYSYHLVSYVNATTKVEVVCSKHGPFWTEPYLHYARAVGCMGCSQDSNRLTRDEFVTKANKIHDGRWDYTEVNYTTHCDPVAIHCSKHGLFVQEPRVHLGGSGCSQCFIDRKRSSIDEFVQQSRVIHGDRYNYDRVVYKTSKEKVEIVCLNHGPFWVKPNGHLSGSTGCPRCKESKGETRIRTFLEKHGISFIQEHKVKPYLFRYDFYIPAYTMLLEFHGQQHYRPIEHFGGESSFEERVKNDSLKENIAKDNGLYLAILDYHTLKDSRIEGFLERVLRYNGHVFDESLTVTSTGPSVVVISHKQTYLIAGKRQ